MTHGGPSLFRSAQIYPRVYVMVLPKFVQALRHDFSDCLYFIIGLVRWLICVRFVHFAHVAQVFRVFIELRSFLEMNLEAYFLSQSVQWCYHQRKSQLHAAAQA